MGKTLAVFLDVVSDNVMSLIPEVVNSRPKTEATKLVECLDWSDWLALFEPCQNALCLCFRFHGVSVVTEIVSYCGLRGVSPIDVPLLQDVSY